MLVNLYQKAKLLKCKLGRNTLNAKIPVPKQNKIPELQMLSRRPLCPLITPILASSYWAGTILLLRLRQRTQELPKIIWIRTLHLTPFRFYSWFLQGHGPLIDSNFGWQHIWDCWHRCWPQKRDSDWSKTFGILRWLKVVLSKSRYITLWYFSRFLRLDN